MQILIVMGLFIAAIMIMVLGLHFSQFKKRKSGCCGASALIDGDKGASCAACPTKEEE